MTISIPFYFSVVTMELAVHTGVTTISLATNATYEWPQYWLYLKHQLQVLLLLMWQGIDKQESIFLSLKCNAAQYIRCRYLNYAIGGATVWPYTGMSVNPEKGSATYWHNFSRSGRLDELSNHAACPVILGSKWIGTKWIRYSSQWDSAKGRCGLFKENDFHANSYIT